MITTDSNCLSLQRWFPGWSQIKQRCDSLVNYSHGLLFRGLKAHFEKKKNEKEKKKNSTKVVIWSVVSISRPLSGVGIHVDVSLWMYVSLSLPGAHALTFNLFYPPSPLSLFPSISLHIFPSAFSAHQGDSPEVEDNPSSEQWVFHVLGRHAEESAASSLSSLQIPASVSQPHCLCLFFFLSPSSVFYFLCSCFFFFFLPMFMFSFIM